MKMNRTIHALIIALTTFSAHSSVHNSTTHHPMDFKSRISFISPQMQSKMKQMLTWHEGCPVPFNELRSITLSYWGFDNKPHLGRLIINQSVATEVVKIFKSLYHQHFPIKQMEPMDLFKGDDDLAVLANNTSSFNCRAVTGQPGVFSQHSYGQAIDINPLINPYVKNNRALTTASDKYVDRHLPFPGKITKDSQIYKVFIQNGWDWGGDWYDVQDYQHFEKRAHGEKRNPYGYGRKNKSQPGDIERIPCLVLLDPINASKIPVSTSQVIIVHSTGPLFKPDCLIVKTNFHIH
ncbi:MAG: M15 family metallopeptidase [Legionellales bacterium]